LLPWPLIVRVAAHVEDDLPLLVLCKRQTWKEMLERIVKLRTEPAVAELFTQDEFGRTAYALACAYEAPVAVLESILMTADCDAKRRNILDIVDCNSFLPLHFAAQLHSDPAAIKFLVRKFPRAPQGKQIVNVIETNRSSLNLLKQLTIPPLSAPPPNLASPNVAPPNLANIFLSCTSSTWQNGWNLIKSADV